MDTTDNWFDYLQNVRKISPKVIQEASLFVSDGWLAIPVKDEKGVVIFNKYRKAPWMGLEVPKYRYEKGSTAHLYGIQHLTGISDVTIVEGEMDVLAMRTCGYTAVSSTGGSQTFRTDWIITLAPHNLTIMYDNDEAGIKGAVKLAFMLRDCTYRWIPPLYGKDANDVLMNFGEEKLHQIMQGVDNSLAVHIPSLDKEAAIIAYRKHVSVILKGMSSGSVGSMFLRELIVQLSVQLSSLKTQKRRKPTDDTRLAYAKAYPIHNLIKVQTDRKAFCPFHQHKYQTPSLHVYPNNTVYCFSCGKSGDVLTVYAQLNNLDVKKDFIQILEKLCNLST